MLISAPLHAAPRKRRLALNRLALAMALAAVGAVSLLSGCKSVGPDFKAPPAPAPKAWQAPVQVGVTTKPADQVRWWDSFGDPVLSKLIESAYQNNYNLKIAGLRVLEARAQLGIAVGTLYPQGQQLQGAANYTAASQNAANTAGGDLNFWEYQVGGAVSWELDFWGKFRRGVESADSSLLANIAAYDNTLVLLISQVADTYVILRTAEEQLRVAQDNLKIQQQGMNITQARFKGGDVGELDVLLAQAQLLSTEATIPQIESSRQQAHNALATLLGVSSPALRPMLGDKAGAIPQVPTEIAAGAPVDLLRRRPDVRQAELLAATQSALVGVSEADLYPSFGLTGFLGVVAADGTNTTRTGNSGVGQLFSGDSLTFFGGPYFSWNILNYGRIRNNVRVQDARLQQALVGYQSTVLNAVKETEDGMVAFMRSHEQERVLAKFEDAAKRALQLANIGYREGFSDFQRVLDAQTSLLQAQRQSVTARSTTVSSAISVFRALGGGWQIRDGQDYVDASTKETMAKRVDWGELLQTPATRPPFKGQSGWPSPDW